MGHSCRLAVLILALVLTLSGGDAVAKKGGGGKPGGGGGDPTPADPAIVYCDKDTGDIVVIDAHGSNPTVVVEDAGSLLLPAWSPDGTKIAFQGSALGTGIHVVNLDGTGLTKIHGTDLGIGAVAWSPVKSAAGKYQIAFADYPEGGQWTDLYLVDEDGQNPVQLTTTTSIGEGSPTWNGDGDQLAYLAQWNDPVLEVLHRDLVVREMATGIEEGLLFGSTSALDGARLSNPDWSRLGDDIVVAADAGDGYTTLWIVDAGGGSAPVEINPGQCSGPSWSSDDSEIAYYETTSRRKDRGLYVMSSDGRSATKVAGSEAIHPDWLR